MQECVRSFQQVTGLGCLLCTPDGSVVCEFGYSVRQCRLCEALLASQDLCVVSRSRAWHEAERFGGKYIYSCPMGLTCIATPVQTDFDTIGYVTAGPLLMVEAEDYLQCELQSCAADTDRQREAQEVVRRIPYVPPEQVEPIAKQFFLSVGGVGKSHRIGDMIEQQNTIRLMGDLSEFTSEAKKQERQHTYPLQLEKEFLRAVSVSDKPLAESLLNQLLGHIFFLTGGNFSYIRARICELLVLSARAAIDGGADETSILSLCQKCIAEMQDIYDVDKLCSWLTAVLKQLMNLLFSEDAAVSRDSMPCALSYIRTHCGERITLDEVARMSHLSPSYFSRLFKTETGQTFSEYLLAIRIERAKSYLRRKDCSMTAIAEQTGFFDQSHFIKSFKHATGVTPGLYRRRRGRGYDELKEQKKTKG
jgi:two-component system, response regulator YesN